MTEVLSEVHSKGEVEIAGMRVVEVILAHVGKSNVISRFYIEVLESKATAQTETTVEAPEVVSVVIAEAAVGFPLPEVFDFSTYSATQETTGEGFHSDAGRGCVTVFHNQGHLKIVERVGEFIAVVGAFSTFL